MSYRLDGYELLMQGSGTDGMFSYVDHQWLIPAYLSLSVVTVAAAALVLVSGWTGQIRASFYTISAVLIFSVALDLILPNMVRRLAEATVVNARQAPYAATRAAFTARAYGLPRTRADSVPREVNRFASVTDSAHVAKVISAARDSTLVYPGASGAALVTNGKGVAAPILGSGLRRIALAWSEQRLDLSWSDYPEGTRIARKRDVRERVGALFPVFAQSREAVPSYLGDSLIWVVELYSSSSTYPLSKRFRIAGEDRSYFRHAGTALVSAATGKVTFVPSTNPDAIAVAWRKAFPANIRPGIPDLLDELSATARPVSQAGPIGGSPATDAAFRAEVSRLYARMRSALAAGDLKSFGAAYDSLGAVVGR